MQEDPRYDDVVAEVSSLPAGTGPAALRPASSEVWVDPGIGFGKTIDHNLALLRPLAELAAAAGRLRRCLVGTSRKRFLGILRAALGRRRPAPAERLRGIAGHGDLGHGDGGRDGAGPRRGGHRPGRPAGRHELYGPAA